jgi:hypothetical protein
MGRVDLVGVHGPFTADKIGQYRHLHQVPASDTATYSGPKGLYAWEMTGEARPTRRDCRLTD